MRRPSLNSVATRSTHVYSAGSAHAHDSADALSADTSHALLSKILKMCRVPVGASDILAQLGLFGQGGMMPQLRKHLETLSSTATIEIILDLIEEYCRYVVRSNHVRRQSHARRRSQQNTGFGFMTPNAPSPVSPKNTAAVNAAAVRPPRGLRSATSSGDHSDHAELCRDGSTAASQILLSAASHSKLRRQPSGETVSPTLAKRTSDHTMTSGSAGASTSEIATMAMEQPSVTTVPRHLPPVYGPAPTVPPRSPGRPVQLPRLPQELQRDAVSNPASSMSPESSTSREASAGRGVTPLGMVGSCSTASEVTPGVSPRSRLPLRRESLVHAINELRDAQGQPRLPHDSSLTTSPARTPSQGQTPSRSPHHGTATDAFPRPSTPQLPSLNTSGIGGFTKAMTAVDLGQHQYPQPQALPPRSQSQHAGFSHTVAPARSVHHLLEDSTCTETIDGTGTDHEASHLTLSHHNSDKSAMELHSVYHDPPLDLNTDAMPMPTIVQVSIKSDRGDTAAPSAAPSGPSSGTTAPCPAPSRRPGPPTGLGVPSQDHGASVVAPLGTAEIADVQVVGVAGAVGRTSVVSLNAAAATVAGPPQSMPSPLDRNEASDESADRKSLCSAPESDPGDASPRSVPFKSPIEEAPTSSAGNRVPVSLVPADGFDMASHPGTPAVPAVGLRAPSNPWTDDGTGTPHGSAKPPHALRQFQGIFAPLNEEGTEAPILNAGGPQRLSGSGALSLDGSEDEADMDPCLMSYSAVQGQDTDGNDTVNDYTLWQEIGAGACGVVFLAIDNVNNIERAIKVLDRGVVMKSHRGPKELADLEQVMVEVAVMKKLRHKNIVTLFEVIDDVVENQVFLVMQYVKDGPLLKLTDDYTCTPMKSAITRKYLRQLASALNYMHRKGVVHGDIKPDNILHDGENVFLSDFGISRLVNEKKQDQVRQSFAVRDCGGSQVSRTVSYSSMAFGGASFAGGPRSKAAALGTPLFLAPECFEGADPGPAADMWAVGITLYVMVFGCVPFNGDSYPELKISVCSDELVFPPDAPKSTKPFETLISELLERDPVKRKTAAQLRKETRKMALAGQSFANGRFSDDDDDDDEMATAAADFAEQVSATDIAKAVRRGSNVHYSQFAKLAEGITVSMDQDPTNASPSGTPTPMESFRPAGSIGAGTCSGSVLAGSLRRQTTNQVFERAFAKRSSVVLTPHSPSPTESSQGSTKRHPPHVNGEPSMTSPAPLSPFTPAPMKPMLSDHDGGSPSLLLSGDARDKGCAVMAGSLLAASKKDDPTSARSVRQVRFLAEDEPPEENVRAQ